MKSFCIYILSLQFFIIPVFSQKTDIGISFFAGNFEAAQLKAQQNNKLLFIDMYTDWCKPCKQMDKYVFTNKDVGERFNEFFVNIKIDAESVVGIPISEEFGVISYPTYIFATADGDMVYKVKGAMTPTQLIEEATKAKSIAKNYKPLSELSEDYKNGERGSQHLYNYLRQKSLKEGRQPSLLEEYIAAIPKSEYKTEKVLNIISKNITSVDSQGFKVLNASLSSFEHLNERQRNAIINGITTAKKLTFKKVLETNDIALFDKLIEAVHATAYSNSGAVSEERQFRFDFAKITQNFISFRKIAIEQGDFLMNKSAEELAFETQQAVESFKEQATARNLNNKSQYYLLMLSSLDHGAEKAASYQLNELAWGYVIMAETNGDLEKALQWSERSLALYKSPANLDTKAHLLYRLGERKEAISVAKEAIKLGKKMGNNTVSLQEALKKMKKNQPIRLKE